MAHLSTRTKGAKHTVDRRYATFGVSAARQAQDTADRTDLVVTVAPGIANGTALFAPHTAEIEVNADLFTRVAWDDGETLDDRLVRLSNLTGYGALIHEAGHAAYSVHVPASLAKMGWTSREIDVWTVLEESRIESLILRKITTRYGKGSQHAEDVALALRSCAFEVTVKDFRLSTTTRYEAAAAGTLILGRIEGGTLDATAAEDVRIAVEAVLGADDLAALRDVWTRFHTVDAHDDAAVKALVHEWLAIVGVDPEDESDESGLLVAGGVAGEGDEGEGAEGGAGGEGKGEGEGEGSLTGAVGRIAADADAEGTEKRGEERAERRAADREADKRRKASGEKHRAKAETKGRETDKQMGMDSDGRTGSGYESVPRLAKVTAEARRGAVALGKALSKIDYSDRTIVETASVVPPGRLNTRRMVGHAAAKAQGRASRSPLFTAKKRRHTDVVPLTVGIIQDVSGSMGGAVEPVGVTSWMLTDASLRIDARVATILMGHEARFSRLPGKHDASQIRYDSAPEGYEAFTDAFLALDAALDLLDGPGARLLVLASDGYYGGSHASYCDEALRLCRAKGVAVVWLRFHGGQDTHGFGTVVDCRGLTATQIAEEVGREAQRALKRAKRIAA